MNLFKNPLPRCLTTVVFGALASLTGSAATHYVWQDSPSPGPPYTNWATAAHVIQDAVDAAVDGDTVLVTNGVYATGGRAVVGIMTNRVAVDRAITLLSINGPEATLIQGWQVPGIITADGAIRCVYLTNGASLSGFTLTNGAAGRSGYSGYLHSGGGIWCESPSTVVSNCVLTGNAAQYGGGGTFGGTLYNCTLSGNSAGEHGGGVLWSTVRNSILTGNSARVGGGASGSTLYNCTLTGNSAEYGGGVAIYSDCDLIEIPSLLYNCIVYRNRAADGTNFYGFDYLSLSFAYSCTTPLPPGEGNIDEDPLLISASHVSTASPCVATGSSEFTTNVDIDGQPWSDPPCMGADQVMSPATGSLQMQIQGPYTDVAVGYRVPFVAHNEGPVLTTAWDFGDSTTASNRGYVSHSWIAPGSYTVRLTGRNDSFPDGITATIEVKVSDEVHYVNITNPTPVFPYTSWETAATTIQEGIEAAAIGGLVLVGDGIYESGGLTVAGGMSNRVALTDPVVVQSLNGPEKTVIAGTGPSGSNAVRCAYLGEGAVVSGFTLTNGHTTSRHLEHDGGGVWCKPSGVVTNCLLINNSAGWRGGGAYRGSLYNCILTGNSASQGGGASHGTLYDCSLTGNSAGNGGGAVYGSTLHNCALNGNSAGEGGGALGYYSYYCPLGSAPCTLYSCTLTGNLAEQGGGAYQSTLYNCALVGNSATGSSYEAGAGGAVHGGTLYNCILTGNSASEGGGVAGGTLYNCTLTGNSASVGGGVGAYVECGIAYCDDIPSTVYNCIIYHNYAPDSPNYSAGTFHYCCTTPLPSWPSNLAGNITNAPAFLNAAAGDYRLAPNSPCIDAGSDFDLGDGTYLSDIITTDLDGVPRPLDGDGDGIAQFDMGAYEFVRELTATEAVQELILAVDASSLDNRRKRPLEASLLAALASIDRDRINAAVNQLKAFQNKVKAQVTRRDPQLAEDFIIAAQAIIDALTKAEPEPGPIPNYPLE